MVWFKNVLIAAILFSSAFCHAQFLPNNTALNIQSVQRWMASNRDFAPVMQTLEAMHKTESELKKFDALPSVAQDPKITAFLQEKKMWESANAIALRHGWKSVGEYMRLSTKLGNAIASYFFAQEIEHLSEVQAKALRAKTDPAILATPAEDVAFVKANENLLKNYIQAYAKGH